MTLKNILDGWNKKNYASVKWGETLSPIFKLNSGSRQGEVSRPALFAIFINDLLEKLQQSFRKCFIKSVCFKA